ncbi:MAG TPA: SRPBCC family protein [Acidimicrobiales bacterium]|nr:SRPBCC family protein [Acidimicrobiales bacterium]
MELSNEFVVTAPIAATWAILTDLERIAPCLPGAQLDEIEGDEYRGTVKVKVGPITSQYKGIATFVSLDETGHKAVLRATGRDTRGQGNATATVTAQLSEEGEKTRVSVVTELDITGKVAQFGRGMLADISTKLLGQFAERLENDVVGSFAGAAPSVSGEDETSVAKEPAAPTPEPTAGTSGIRQIAPTRNAPVDLGRLAGPSMLKAIPVIGVVVLAIVKIFRQRSRQSRGS